MSHCRLICRSQQAACRFMVPIGNLQGKLPPLFPRTSALLEVADAALASQGEALTCRACRGSS